MSLLLKPQLEEAMGREAVIDRLIVQPLLDSEQVGSGSIDLRLGTHFVEVKRHHESEIDALAPPRKPNQDTGEESVYVPLGEYFVLHPGQFVLGATFEFIRLPYTIGGQVLSRSSWGRLGLLVATAVAIQPGFAGVLTLELVNAGNVPIRLYPGLRVAQLQLWSSDVAVTPSTSGEPYDSPLGPESNKPAWKQSEVDLIREIGLRLLAAPEARS